MAGEVSQNDKLRVAACKGDVETIKELYAAGAKFDVDKYGRTALHYAAHYGLTSALKQCIALRCALDVQDTFGCTALHKSVIDGHVEATTALLEAGCDVEARDENGHTALHEAAWSGYSKTVEVLVKVGKANIHAVNKNGQKPIHLAVQNGHNETTRVLLKAGTNPDIKNNENGETPLHVACLFGHVTCARILLSAGGNVNAQNKVGNTPLHIAAGLGKKKVTRLLIESGCGTHLRNKNNQLPLELARNNDHSDVVLLILSAHKIKKSAKKSFFSRKKKHISDESRDSSSDLGSQKDRSQKEKLEESTLESSSPRVKGWREFREQNPRGDESDEKRKGRRSRDSDSKDSRGYRSNRETRKRREKERDKQRVEEDSKLAQAIFAKDELRRKIEREKRLHHDVHVGRMTGDPHKRVQYVKDKNGKVIEIPMSFNCQCTPYIRKLENQIEATKEGLLHEIDLSRSKFESRMRNLDKRMSHQAQCLDQLSRERVAAERTECLHRIDRRAGEERAVMQEEQEARVELLRQEMKEWFEDRIQPLHDQLRDIYIEEDQDGRRYRSPTNMTSLYQDSGVGMTRTQSEKSLSDLGRTNLTENGVMEEKDNSSQVSRSKIEKSQLRRHLSELNVDHSDEREGMEDYISRGARPKETRSSGTTTDSKETRESRTDTAPLVSASYRPPLVTTQERMFSVTGRVLSPDQSSRVENGPSRLISQGYMMSNHVSDQSSGDDSSDSDSEITETKSQTVSVASSTHGSLVNGRAKSESGVPHRQLSLASNSLAAAPTVRSNTSHVPSPLNQTVVSASKKPYSSGGSTVMSTCSSSGISSAKSASSVSSTHRNPPPPLSQRQSVQAQVHEEPNHSAHWRNRPRQVMDVPPPVPREQAISNPSVAPSRQNDRGREWRSSEASSQSSVSSFKLAMKNGRELQL